MYTIETAANDCKARAGILHTAHGRIRTPIFMPVGTQGAVKALQHRELEEIGAEIILGNTYHLYLRPGRDALQHFGGLHRFMNWDRPILTDSGGYQVFSLKELRKLSEEGVEFRSHIDGSKHVFTPENVIETQRIIGADIIMTLDECTPYPSTYEYADESLKRTLRWAQRCKDEIERTKPHYGHEQALFGIGQGSVYPELRRECLLRLIDMEFPGYAIGGLSVGESADEMYEIVDVSTSMMPAEKPRYLMGVGTPENLLECIELGIDMFDCVMPTRNARNGQLFTTRGKINLRNEQYRLSDSVIDEQVDSYASKNFSLGYLRHLVKSNEILGLQLATQHNVAFYLWLVKAARSHIVAGDYRQWKRELIASMQSSVH